MKVGAFTVFSPPRVGCSRRADSQTPKDDVECLVCRSAPNPQRRPVCVCFFGRSDFRGFRFVLGLSIGPNFDSM